MKRFLLLFCTVVLVCSIMVVPAFASSDYVLSCNAGMFEYHGSIPSGKYELQLSYYDADEVLHSYHCDFIEIGEYIPGAIFLPNGSEVRVLNFQLINNSDPDDLSLGSLHIESAFHEQLQSDVTICFLEMDGISFQGIYGATLVLTPVGSDPEPVGFELLAQSVQTSLLIVIAWVSIFVSALVSSQGALNGLLPMFAIFVAIPALFFGVKAVKSFLWGA